MKNRKPKADGRYVVNVSFTANETSLLSWADGHGNFSNYIKKLIAEDMKKGGVSAEPVGFTNEMLQTMFLKMLGQQAPANKMPNINPADEVAVGMVEEEPQEEPKQRANKSALGKIMTKKK